MNKQKLLIADPSESFALVLGDRLSDICEIRICRTGADLLDHMEHFRPDILLMELVLPEFDGLTFLKKLFAKSERPAVLVATHFLTEFVETSLVNLEVDYVVRKPCNLRSLTDRIRDLCRLRGANLPGGAVTELLLGLDISTKCGGFRYLETAVSLYSQDSGQSMTKELYPAVARLCGGNGESVERAIRSVIHSAWKRRDERIWRQYFQAGRTGTVPRPTNTQFIATVSQRLRQDGHGTRPPLGDKL